MFHNISDMLALFTLEETQYLTRPARAFEDGGGGGGGGKCPRPITLKLFMVLK